MGRAAGGPGAFLLAALIATGVMWAPNLPFFLHGLRRHGLLRPPPAEHGWDAPPIVLRTSRFGYIWQERPTP